MIQMQCTCANVDAHPIHSLQFVNWTSISIIECALDWIIPLVTRLRHLLTTYLMIWGCIICLESFGLWPGFLMRCTNMLTSWQVAAHGCKDGLWFSLSMLMIREINRSSDRKQTLPTGLQLEKQNIKLYLYNVLCLNGYSIRRKHH